MQKVELFLVGQPKSGTTALANFLNQHPEIVVSLPKETGYFATDLRAESDAFHGKPKYFHIRTLKRYQDCFTADKNQVMCDASTNYLYSEEAAKNIYTYNKKAKIIIMLRDPVEMVYSLFNQYKIENKEDFKTLEQALEHEEERRNGAFLNKKYISASYLYYSERAKYYQQVKRFLDVFDKDQVSVILFDEFKKDNLKIYHEVLRFVEVNDTKFIPKIATVNEKKSSRSNLISRIAHNHKLKNALLKTVGQRNYTKFQLSVGSRIVYKKGTAVPMSNETISNLQKIIKPDLKRLSGLLGMDLVTYWWGQK